MNASRTVAEAVGDVTASQGASLRGGFSPTVAAVADSIAGMRAEIRKRAARQWSAAAVPVAAASEAPAGDAAQQADQRRGEGAGIDELSQRLRDCSSLRAQLRERDATIAAKDATIAASLRAQLRESDATASAI